MVAALLIAAGAVIRLTVPPMFGITPNFAIAMYSLAILLIRPRFGEAIGIGIVAGLVCMFSSKAAYPVNLASETVGAVVCYSIMNLFIRINKFAVTTLITTALATLASGIDFCPTTFSFNLLRRRLCTNVNSVITITVLNAIIAHITLFPRQLALKK